MKYGNRHLQSRRFNSKKAGLEVRVVTRRENNPHPLPPRLVAISTVCLRLQMTPKGINTK